MGMESAFAVSVFVDGSFSFPEDDEKLSFLLLSFLHRQRKLVLNPQREKYPVKVATAADLLLSESTMRVETGVGFGRRLDIEDAKR